MRQYYLNILGLEKDATPEQIKKAFRKKAMQYHPDKNPGKDANDQFVKVCQAYEKLNSGDFSEVGSKEQRPKEYYKRRYHRDLSPEELEIRLKKAQIQAKIKQVKEKHIHQLSYYELKKKKIHIYSNIIGIISILLGTLLLTDYVIKPPEEHKATIIGRSIDGYNVKFYLFDYDEQDEAKQQYTLTTDMENSNFRFLPVHTVVNVYKSPILDEPLAVSLPGTDYDYSMFNRKTIYFGFWAFIILLYLPWINFVARGPNSVYIIFVHINAYLPIFVMSFIAIAYFLY